MNNTFNYITKVEIKGLWGFDDLNFVWNLNKGVNVLAGPNGSGKSTVLKLIVSLLNHKHPIRNSITPELFRKAIVCLGDEIWRMESTDFVISYFESNKKGINALSDVYFIDSFDKFIPLENIQKTTREGNVKTLLDLELFWLEQDYKDYKLDITKKVLEIVNNKKIPSVEKNSLLLNLGKRNALFLDIIDNLFAPTDKKIDRESNNIQFIIRNTKTILPNQLSSGEKQMLIILLSTLIQDNKPAIMIMDEPELSLHTDWQEALIDNIRMLNENMQIIIATHSPFIISQGWADKVFQMEDLLSSTKNEKANG